MVFPDGVYGDLQEHLFPSEGHPFHGMGERGVFCVIAQSTGRRRVSLVVRDVVPPENPDDLSIDTNVRTRVGDRGRGEPVRGWFRFSKDYHNRALRRAKELGGGLLRIHTQPGYVQPSRVDRHSAERVFSEDVDRTPMGAPLAAAITNEQGAWSARAYEFGADDEVIVTPVTAVRVVGPEFEKKTTLHSPLGPGGARGRLERDRQESTVELWGAEGQEILAGLRVGIVGCGGVGSLLAAQLPRLGVGGLVLVDFDRLKSGNANRAGGAVPDDIRRRRLKTTVAEREARKAATAPDFELKAVDGSVVEKDPDYAAVPDILDCDVIVAAVDAARPRRVLDRLASAHCIPVINAGSRLPTEPDGTLRNAAKIETSVTGPGFPCFRCQRVWDIEDAGEERENPRFRGEANYVEGGVDPEDGPRAPSVIGVNSVAAGLAQLRLQALVLGTATHIVGVHRIKPRKLSANWMAQMIACPDDCDRASIAAGDNEDLRLGTDRAMRYERDDIPDADTKTIDPGLAEEILDPD